MATYADPLYAGMREVLNLEEALVVVVVVALLVVVT
jgi:hypothetical protein